MTSQTLGASALGGHFVKPTDSDPYRYQTGFGNRFASEAIPGTLPFAQNMPRRNKYDLYTEFLTGNTFTAPRAENMNCYLYRIRPSVVHRGIERLPDNTDLTSTFLPINPNVHVSPRPLVWKPFDMPSKHEHVDFVDGIKTLAGNGDPTLQEGLAIHVYLANASMEKRAFCDLDGDMMIVPVEGRLDVQTEMGRIMVKPSELVVVPRGIRFRVSLPDGTSRGYCHEVFGSHYTLPDLGPLGGHGLANPRDFETPVAAFDIDQTPWKVIYKLAGELHLCSQEQTPFDVVAWHGNYVPYKYGMEKFMTVGSVSKDHVDPSVVTALVAKSSKPGIELCTFGIFLERWEVATNTFRAPPYHRNSAVEFLGVVYGSFGGRSEGLKPGGASMETGFCPHGVTNDDFVKGVEEEQVPKKIFVGTLGIIWETSVPLTVSDFAMNRSGKLQNHNAAVWDELKPNFLKHIDTVNADLEAAGLPPLSTIKVNGIKKGINGLNGTNGIHGANGMNGTNGVHKIKGINGHGTNGVNGKHKHDEESQLEAKLRSLAIHMN
ncbi:homogentisate 1,2-dioxygenase [Amanita muscaria]